MIVSNFTINGWNVELINGVDGKYNIEYILDELYKVRCTYKQATEAYKTIYKKEKDIGFTYANYFTQSSVMFIGKPSSFDQLLNTIAHESRHLQQYIADYYGIDQNSEDVCYLLGNLVQKIYQILIDNTSE